MRVAFLHPDLGIGGAERLIVDAAVSLKSKGDSVCIYTSHCDPGHSFVETQDGTLDVKVFGDFLPTTIFGRFKAMFSIIRMMFVAAILIIQNYSRCKTERYDAIVVDQVSFPVPFLQMFSSAKVLFYCHYPDQLLTTRPSFLKKLYRYPLDWAEEWTTLRSDLVVVNSRYTQGVYLESFRSLASQSRDPPSILYPAFNFKSLDVSQCSLDTDLPAELQNRRFFLSLNRFERKKNVELALDAFILLKNRYQIAEFEDLRLVIAGGYDVKLPENKEYYEELRAKVHQENLEDQVLFLRSCSDRQKTALLYTCFSVIYTPTNEHFGIVPVEAMFCNRPVIAVNKGGPKESVLHEETGYLCEDNPEAFSQAMSQLLADATRADEMGRKGHTWVVQKFSLEALGQQLHQHLEDLQTT